MDNGSALDDTTIMDWKQESTVAPSLSRETVETLLALVDSLTLSMSNPNIEQQFELLRQARAELLAIR